MKIIDHLYRDQKPLYPIERICPADQALFIDIETTGLKKETTSLYLIGCGYYTKKGFETKLFFADSSFEEEKILRDFREFSARFTHLFHYNGMKFDIPYLEYKAEKYGISDLFKDTVQIDIYRMCKPLRYLLFPETMKQKAIEDFLGITRLDRYNGGQLIEVYKDYEKTPCDDFLEPLITHNREDVLGMHLIMPILYYLDLKDADLAFEGYRINDYRDYNGEPMQEVFFDYRTDVFFPRSFFSKTDTMYVKASSDTGKITFRLPLYTGEMKVFFEDYRNYCYLPEEDMAVVKTIACTLPKDRYKKATRENCYQKVSGSFLKQPDSLFTPVLKTAYKDKKKYFRFPEDFKKETAEQFGRLLLNVYFAAVRKK